MKPLTLEHKEKISKGNRGTIRSKDAIRRSSEGNKKFWSTEVGKEMLKRNWEQRRLKYNKNDCN
jgi:hypothetical protein